MRRLRAAAAAACAVAAAVLFAGCGGSSGAAQEAPATAAAPATGQAPAGEAGSDVTASVDVQGGEPVGGEARIEARAGDEVTIEVTVDEPQELHLHGYDLEQEAAPGAPAVFRFTADLEGVFELESHALERVVAKVVVSP